MEPSHFAIIVVITTLLSVIFSGAEIAILSVWKMQFDIETSPNSLIFRFKRAIRENPEKYLFAIATVNYIVFVLFVVAFNELLSPVFESFILSKFLIILLTVTISAIAVLLFGKLIPKIIFPFFPDKLVGIYLVIMSFFWFLLYPLIFLIEAVKSTISKAGTKNKNGSIFLNPYFSRIGTNLLFQNNQFKQTEKKEGLNTEVQLFKNALDFSKVKLREIMVPRTEIEVLDLNSSMEELQQKFVETGFSRIIFYDENIDNIIGYVHSSVIFKNPQSFKPFIKDVLIVPETMPANKLLSTFISEHRSIAIVVDEFGGTSGMVTSEDILEEIFGEIEDEHDTNDIIEKKISETEFIFSGRSEIDLLNEKYQINLPETEDFETLAGFILFHHESIPKINSVIKIGLFQFKILKATNTRIELVKLTIAED
ncbi:MAG TPA: hemolysin family protein [Draconibacterium sp.]|nr:hemolysin family protein [Draconibacterium sp.]